MIYGEFIHLFHFSDAMACQKGLTDNEIMSLLYDTQLSDNEEDLDDISDEEYVPNDSSSEDEYEEEEDTGQELVGNPPGTANYLVAPSGDKWYKTCPAATGRLSSINVITTKPGPTVYSSARMTECPSSAFDLIFDHEMTKTILIETNREGKRIKKDNFLEITNEEIRAFLGLCILRGVHKSKNQDVRDLWSSNGPPIFAQTMSINRFEEIRRFLRFDNPATRAGRISRDKLAAVRLLIDGFVKNSQLCYNHSECTTVDEQLYPFRGRCRFIQYMPSKPAKYGLKFWILADGKNYYISNIELYTGKDDTRTTDLGMHVVLKLVKHIHFTGRNITTDNFFTSLKLARELKSKNLSLVGTLRGNRRELPKEMRNAKIGNIFDSEFVFSSDNIQLLSYKTKKNKKVHLLSSQHTSCKLNNTPKRKPDTISYYNHTKGGVDCADERIGTYSVKYKTKRWHVTVFCNILDMACLNAFILFCDVFPKYNEKKSNKRKLFLGELGLELSKRYRDERKSKEIARHIHVSSESSKKRSRCSLCSRSVDRKTSTKCKICDKYVCPMHSIIKCLDCGAM